MPRAPKKQPKQDNPGNFKTGEDKRRRGAPKGNRNAVGNRSRPNRDFISQQLIACLHEKVKDPETNEEKEKYAVMVDALVDNAMEGDPWAQQFVWERVEGKVANPVSGKIEHSHTLDMILPELTDDELGTLMDVSKRALAVSGVKVIEHIPGEGKR